MPYNFGFVNCFSILQFSILNVQNYWKLVPYCAHLDHLGVTIKKVIIFEKTVNSAWLEKYTALKGNLENLNEKNETYNLPFSHNPGVIRKSFLLKKRKKSLCLGVQLPSLLSAMFLKAHFLTHPKLNFLQQNKYL